MLQPLDTTSLAKADLDSVCVRARSFWNSSNTPTEPPFISSTRAPALESSTRSESKNALSAVLFGCVVGLCSLKLKPKGPKGSKHLVGHCTPPPNVIPLTLWGVYGWSFILQPRYTMSLTKADFGLVCRRVRSSFGTAQPPRPNRPLSPLLEHLHWGAQRDTTARMLFLQTFLGRGVSSGYVGSI